MAMRFALYGVLGWVAEILWTAAGSTVTGKQKGWGLAGTTYLWMFPIYGLLAPLYEPAHNTLRHRPWPLRAIVYGAGFLVVEYASGWVIKRIIGGCPWDYTGRARWQLHGLIRLDYYPAWALFGMLLEPVHDFLVRLTPRIRRAAGSSSDN